MRTFVKVLLLSFLFIWAGTAPAVWAQKASVSPNSPATMDNQKPKSTVGLQMATRIYTPSDSRFSAGASVFRVSFPASGEMALFYEMEHISLNFLNTGATTPVVGAVQSELVGMGLYFGGGAYRFELSMGRGSTYIGGATVLASNDPVMNLGGYWSYYADRGFIDLGLIYRSQNFSYSLAGNALGGGTGTEAVKSLGGTAIHIGAGFLF